MLTEAELAKIEAADEAASATSDYHDSDVSKLAAEIRRLWHVTEALQKMNGRQTTLVLEALAKADEQRQVAEVAWQKVAELAQ